MKDSPILHIAVPAPLPRCFDYLPPIDGAIKDFPIGVRVRIPFGKRETIGVLNAVSQTSTAPGMPLKHALEIIDDTPLLPPTLLELTRWASDYYHHPIGEVLFSALPVLLRSGKIISNRRRGDRLVALGETIEINNSNNQSITPPLQLNTDQQHAIDTVIAALNQYQTFLLNGVTGSGKTEVYLQIIESVLNAGKQALILVPEIGLTPQTLARFEQRFKVPIAVLHSGLSDRERYDAWLMAKKGIAPIVIGTRSAIFTPLLNPGIIIVDEEHDLSFKQQEGFRYCARDLAIVRGRLEKIPVLLGTATPALESFHNAQQNRYQLLSLPQRVNSAALPRVSLIDLRNQKLENGLSTQLLTSMQQHLDQNGQILLFLNRRGFAPLLICHACGWIANCKRCDAKLIYHQHPLQLQCHHCTTIRPIDRQCPTCLSTHLFPLGLGTQRLEDTLTQHFPGIGIVRIDRDSTRRKGALATQLDTIHSGENKILIGTQMLAKGHHFPEVTLVAILDADSGLFSADFRASERTAQLLLQVAGRAGRADRAGEVLIQTHNPDHPLLLHLLKQDYNSFAHTALQERQATVFPPYSHLALIRAEAVSKELPLTFLKQVRNLATQLHLTNVNLLGPIPALMERKAGRYRAQLLIQAPQRSELHKLLTFLLDKIPTLSTTRRVRWSLDVDPREMV